MRRLRERWVWLAAGVAALLAVGAAVARERHQQHEQLEARVTALTGGNPEAGPVLIGRYGCGGCHEIPGVTGARGKVGPSLKGVAGRVYIAGQLTNRPENMIRWIEHPHAINPKTAMPEMGVTPSDARDIAAYLYTLQ
jgi:cytochrome c2